MKIAVFIDTKGNLLPFYADGIIRLYVFEKNKWTSSKEISIKIRSTLTIAEVRNRILSIITDIDDCKNIVVSTIRGFPRSVFEEKGITIWQYKGVLALALLDQIKESVNNLKEEKVTIQPFPIAKDPTEGGIYEINLAAILESDTSLTSKMLLLPFFQTTVFIQLEIICKHLPKWFDQEFETLQLQVRIEESTDGLCHAVVSPTGIRSIQTSALIDKQEGYKYNKPITTILHKTDEFKCGVRCK